MEREKLVFGEAVVIGVIVMVLFALITVNILAMIPLAGPIIGGIVTGWIAGKDFLNGAKAGFIAGFLGGVLVALDVMSQIPFIRMSVPQVPGAEGVLFLIVALFYFPILSLIGGAIGGMARTGVKVPATP